MSEERSMTIEAIKSSVQHASYVVDPRAVAEAMLRRVVEERALQAPLVPRAH